MIRMDANRGRLEGLFPVDSEVRVRKTRMQGVVRRAIVARDPKCEPMDGSRLVETDDGRAEWYFNDELEGP